MGRHIGLWKGKDGENASTSQETPRSAEKHQKPGRGIKRDLLAKCPTCESCNMALLTTNTLGQTHSYPEMHMAFRTHISQCPQGARC